MIWNCKKGELDFKQSPKLKLQTPEMFLINMSCLKSQLFAGKLSYI